MQKEKKVKETKKEKFMKNWMASIIAGILIICLTAWSQETKLDAQDILNGIDEVTNTPKDQKMTIQITLTDKDNKEEFRELAILQKGYDKRMAKFNSPASQKGIAFLSLPDDVMYLYLPAFKKTRRIASHVKNTKFAGTDFTYEDMEAKKYSEKWIPEFVKNGDNLFVLSLTPKKDVKSDYSKLIMHVRTDNFYPVRIEHFDKGGTLVKIMTREMIEKVDGYWVSKDYRMEDLKTKHKTKMLIQEVIFDSDIQDDTFSERYLSR